MAYLESVEIFGVEDVDVKVHFDALVLTKIISLRSMFLSAYLPARHQVIEPFLRDMELLGYLY